MSNPVMDIAKFTADAIGIYIQLMRNVHEDDAFRQACIDYGYVPSEFYNFFHALTPDYQEYIKKFAYCSTLFWEA